MVADVVIGEATDVAATMAAVGVPNGAALCLSVPLSAIQPGAAPSARADF